MAPHAVLNSDVLDYIFNHFNIVPESNEVSQTRQTLLGAALSCRAFSEPALNALWRTLDSLTPLLKLIPSLKLVDNVYVGSFAASMLSSKLTVSQVLYGMIQDWTRFDYYARRVKEFVYRDADTNESPLHPSVYIRIAQLRPHPLPCLRRFRFLSQNFLIHNIFLFLSPTLQSVELMIAANEQVSTIWAFLSVLGNVAPSLKDLTLETQLLGGTSSLPSILDLHNLVHLRSLALWETGSILDATLLKQIGTMEHLKILSIDLENTNASSGTHYLREGLKVLEKLCISGNLACIAGVLTDISTDRLNTVSICVQGSGDLLNDEMLTPLGIAASRWPGSLRRVVLYGEALDINWSNTDIWTVFKPLRPLSKLEGLLVEDFPSSGLTSPDEEIQALISAWPHIRSLTIPNDNTTTIFALHSIAKLCPHLKSLEMSIKADDVPCFSVTPLLSHSLEKLSVGHSPITDPSLVARHLDRLFPYIRSVAAKGSYADKWREVENLIHIFQDVRLHAKEQTAAGM